MTRRVLIVTSSYAPAMIADMHRARHLAWHLPALGWEVEVLTADAACQQPWSLDRDTEGLFAPEIRIHTVQGSMPRLFRALRMRNIGWRVFLPMKRLGDELLSSGRFDLVYFSTTQFPLFLLGPAWRSRHGVPYVLDLHDPCYREEVRPPSWAKRSLKHEVSRRLAGHVERKSVVAASGLVAVSSEYISTMRRRYGSRHLAWASLGRSSTIPFAVLPRDFEQVGKSPNRAVRSDGDPVRLVYVGAGGPIMKRAFALFCRSLAQLRSVNPAAVARLRVELFGTTLAGPDWNRKILAEVAETCGVGDLIHEDPRRVSYRQSLELLLRADGAMILGVDDSGYMPSKLFSYAYSGKPLLAIVRRDGPAFEAMRGEQALGRALWFEVDREIPVEEGAGIICEFLLEAARGDSRDRHEVLVPHFAEAMARRHAELFLNCCEDGTAR